METIGDRLKRIREKTGFKQKDMADFLGLKRPGYNRIEKGKVDIILKHLIALQKQFNISLDWLITGNQSSGTFLEIFGDYTGTIRQMLIKMQEDPGFLHGILSYFHEMLEKRNNESYCQGVTTGKQP